MHYHPARIHLWPAVLTMLRPNAPIDGDDFVRDVRPSALTDESEQLHCTWPHLHMCVETLRILNRERYKEPLALPLDAPRPCSLLLPHKLRLKRLVRLRYGVSDLNL